MFNNTRIESIPIQITSMLMAQNAMKQANWAALIPITGKFGRAGKLPKEFGTVNAIDCRNANTLYVGEVGNLRVQKLMLH